MGGDDLGVLDRTAVLQVRGDSSRAKRVAAYPLRANTRRQCSALHHSEYVRSCHPLLGESAGLSRQRAKERVFALMLDPRIFQISVEVRLCVVVRGYLVELATFLVESKP